MTKKFTGPLAKPIKLDPDRSEEAMAEVFDKMLLLPGHYGVSEGDWFQVAMNLAMDFVPGFQVKRPRSKRDLAESVMLIVEVQKLLESERNHSPRSAAIRLSERKGSRWEGENAHTLEMRYHRAIEDRRVREFIRYLDRGGVTENGQ